MPYQLVHTQVETRSTATTAEFLFKGRRVAHLRRTGRGQSSPLPEHMPHAHRPHAEWTPSRLIAWAEQTGPATGRFVAGVARAAATPRARVSRLSRPQRLGRVQADRLEAACARAERLRSYRFRTVEHILQSQQDRLPLDEPPAQPPLTHDNMRGAAFYEEAYADPPHD